MLAHTIPTSYHPGFESDIGVDLTEIIGKEAFSSRRPWKEVIHGNAFNLPCSSISDLYLRIQTNILYFKMNYVIIALFIMFFGLICFPFSLFTFSVMLVLWHFLYLVRADADDIVVFGKVVSNRMVLVGLSTFTVVVLILTGTIWDILWSSVVVVAVVLLHAVFRKTDDHCSDEVGPNSTSLPTFG
ncbi:PRA1 (Prenylated rab acceptor) family protein [Zostera marina]|uniref:PRA1 family protein n=1 Tax=Zostera marina TaxID=29655 RepID=A0A0K9PSQ2_ZOSMR|nr:PRA1 (Prenylated rab acceptor) family protein [Zostera marina]